MSQPAVEPPEEAGVQRAAGPPARRGGLIVPVLEAEAAVRIWREQYDPISRAGVPAHVTLLFPFPRLDELGLADLADLRTLFATLPAVRVVFASVGQFPGVVYLCPEPRQWFVDTTELLSRQFGLLPYGGQHRQVVPHLTVAQHPDPEIAKTIRRALGPVLPITCWVREVWLMEEAASGQWERTATFPVAG